MAVEQLMGLCLRTEEVMMVAVAVVLLDPLVVVCALGDEPLALDPMQADCGSCLDCH